MNRKISFYIIVIFIFPLALSFYAAASEEDVYAGYDYIIESKYGEYGLILDAVNKAEPSAFDRVLRASQFENGDIYNFCYTVKNINYSFYGDGVDGINTLTWHLSVNNSDNSVSAGNEDADLGKVCVTPAVSDTDGDYYYDVDFEIGEEGKIFVSFYIPSDIKFVVIDYGYGQYQKVSLGTGEAETIMYCNPEDISSDTYENISGEETLAGTDVSEENTYGADTQEVSVPQAVIDEDVDYNPEDATVLSQMRHSDLSLAGTGTAKITFNMR